MILRSFFAGALLCALTVHAADARPRHHHRHHIPDAGKLVGWEGVNRSPFFAEEISKKSLRHRRFSRVNRHKEITHSDTSASGMLIFSTSFEAGKINTRRPIPPGLHRVMAEGAGRVVGGRPAGCPRRYCGCGASLHIFGRIIPRLNLAANWLRFPRADPAPGMVAARRGHVFVLKQHIRGSTWLVYDANSGRGKTRIHPRSIAGFVIVNPRAGA